MKEINGIARNGGVAIAVAAVVNAQMGINSVSPTLLQEGIKALMRRSSPYDYPEAIVACDSFMMGISVKIPGINTIAIASQSIEDIPEMPLDIPCVIGLDKLIESINEGDILIVDGNLGKVYIDPDPQIIVHYQQITEKRAPTIIVESENIPAETVSGERIYIYEIINSGFDPDNPVITNADGFFADLRTIEDEDFASTVLQFAAGEPVWFILNKSNNRLAEAIINYSAPNQVTLIFEPENFNRGLVDIALTLDELSKLFIQNNEPPAVNLGAIGNSQICEEYGIDKKDCCVLIDLRKKKHSVSICNPNSMAIIEKTSSIKELSEAGIKIFAVENKKVNIAKDFVRSIGREEKQ